MISRSLRTALVAAAVGTLAVACTSTTSGTGHLASPSGAPSSGPSAPSSAPSSAPTSGVSSAPASNGSASTGTGVDLHSLVLQRADVPSDWQNTPNTDTTGADTTERAIIECLGLHVDPTAGRIAQVNSDDFVKNNSRIGSSAQSWQSEAQVRAQLSIVTNPKTGHCYAQVLRNQLPGSLPADVTVDSVQLTLTPGHAGFPTDVVATGHGTVKLSSNGQLATLYVDLAFIAHGTVTADVQFLGFGEQILPTLSSQLVETVAERVART